MMDDTNGKNTGDFDEDRGAASDRAGPHGSVRALGP